MSSGRETARFEADFTDWRVGLENVAQKLRDIRQKLRETAKEHANWTDGARRRAQNLVNEETNLLKIRQQLQQQMRQGAAFGDTTAFANGMKNARMQTLAMAFALDDFMTVMAQQGTGIQGFTAGLAAAANNISIMLIAINPALAILPSLGVLILRGFVKPMIEAEKATEGATKALDDQQKAVRRVIDERRALAIGEDAAREMRKRDDFEEEKQKMMETMDELGRKVKEFERQTIGQQIKGTLYDYWRNAFGLGQLGIPGVGVSMDQIVRDFINEARSAEQTHGAARDQVRQLIGNEQARREMALNRFRGEGEGSPQAMRIRELEQQKERMERAIHEAENAERRTTPKWKIREMKRGAERVGDEIDQLQGQLDDQRIVREQRETNMHLKTLIEQSEELRNRPAFNHLRVAIPAPTD